MRAAPSQGSASGSSSTWSPHNRIYSTLNNSALATVPLWAGSLQAEGPLRRTTSMGEDASSRIHVKLECAIPNTTCDQRRLTQAASVYPNMPCDPESYAHWWQMSVDMQNTRAYNAKWSSRSSSAKHKDRTNLVPIGALPKSTKAERRRNSRKLKQQHKVQPTEARTPVQSSGASLKEMSTISSPDMPAVAVSEANVSAITKCTTRAQNSTQRMRQMCRQDRNSRKDFRS